MSRIIGVGTILMMSLSASSGCMHYDCFGTGIHGICEHSEFEPVWCPSHEPSHGHCSKEHSHHARHSQTHRPAHPKFHPVPTRPVFCPQSIFAADLNLPSKPTKILRPQIEIPDFEAVPATGPDFIIPAIPGDVRVPGKSPSFGVNPKSPLGPRRRETISLNSATSSPSLKSSDWERRR